MSIHASHAWTWLEPSQDYDGNLTKEDGYKPNPDGTEKWWKGLDPQELYAQNHEHSQGWDNSGTIHSQWDWGNGASLPSEGYKMKFQNRVLELIDDYDPAMLYFDDTAMPFYGCDDVIGQNILAHYYNRSAKKNGGKPNVIVTGKQLTSAQKKHMMWDVERGIPDRIQEDYWQTCTCIGDWHYNQATYNNGSYKSAQQVVNMLVDIVSKNGNLLLNIPVKGDGTIDDKEMVVLNEIKEWMDVNSSSIYGTRPWKTFGEGPLAESSHSLNAQGFNEGNNYSSKDVAYCQRNDTLFATIMRWPAQSAFTFKSLGMASDYYSGKVKKIELIGYGEVEYVQTIDGLCVTIPSTKPNALAPVFQMTFEKNTDKVSLSEIIDAYEAKAKALLGEVSYNTGWYSKNGVLDFISAIEDAKQYVNETDSNQKVVIEKLNAEYKKLNTSGRNQAGAPSEEGATDCTMLHLLEGSDFAASELGSRFGTPANWTVENYSVPRDDSSQGIRNGIDCYPGYNTLSLGVWSGEDVEPYTCDLANARIYRVVHLEPGRYYFGSKMESSYNLTDNAFVYVADNPLPSETIESEAIAFAQMNKADKAKFYGVYFTLKEEQDVALCFQANLKDGAKQQEFRLKEVKLNYYGNMDFDALNELVGSAFETLGKAKVNYNTGFYKKEAADRLQAAIEAAEEISEDSTPDEFSEAYSTLQGAVKDFLENGKNAGGQPEKIDATDITEEYLIERADFTRADQTVATRFAAPANWTVENFLIDKGGEGVKNGIDKYPGYNCLSIGIWDDLGNNEEGDAANARLYRKVTLPAGKYYWGAEYNTTYNMSSRAYIFAAEETLSSEEIPTKSVAYYPINKAADNDGLFHGVYFTLDEPKEIVLGFQADLTSGASCQEFRAKGVVLYGYSYGDPSGVDNVAADGGEGDVHVYSVSGVRLNSISGQGLYIVRKGNKAVKVMVK